MRATAAADVLPLMPCNAILGLVSGKVMLVVLLLLLTLVQVVLVPFRCLPSSQAALPLFFSVAEQEPGKPCTHHGITAPESREERKRTGVFEPEQISSCALLQGSFLLS